MKKNLKSFLMGFMSCAVLASSITIGATVKKNIQVLYGNVKHIVVDGADKTPATNKCFIYNGDIYVPFNYVGTITKKKVVWDGNTNTLYLGEHKSTVNYLTDTTPYWYKDIKAYRINNSIDKSKNVNVSNGGYIFYDDFRMKSGGKNYTRGITVITDSTKASQIFYNLNAKYKTLRGLVAFDENYINGRVDKHYTVNFYVDNVLKQSIDLKSGDLPQHVNVNLNKGLRLKVEFIKPADDFSYNPNINLLGLALK